jgi:hypothetical protein
VTVLAFVARALIVVLWIVCGAVACVLAFGFWLLTGHGPPLQRFRYSATINSAPDPERLRRLAEFEEADRISRQISDAVARASARPRRRSILQATGLGPQILARRPSRVVPRWRMDASARCAIDEVLAHMGRPS